MGLSFNPLRVSEFKIGEVREEDEGDGIVIGDVCIYYAFERVLVVLQNDGVVLECQSPSGTPIDVAWEECREYNCDDDPIRCIEEFLLSVKEAYGKPGHVYEVYGMTRGDVVKLLDEIHRFVEHAIKARPRKQKSLYTALELLYSK